VYENNPLLWPSDPGQCQGLSTAIFKASDKDAISDLIIGIDWTKTTAYNRDNQKVTNTSLFVDTFTMSQKNNGQSITGMLEVSTEKFIDCETVARLDLSVYATDQE
jgi:hypothetical protein